MNSPTSSEIAREASQTVNDAMNFTQSSVRGATSSTKGKLQAALERIEPTTQQLTHHLQHALQNGLHTASAGRARVGHRVEYAAATSRKFVSDQPLRTVLAAAAMGAAITGLVMLANRR